MTVEVVCIMMKKLVCERAKLEREEFKSILNRAKEVKASFEETSERLNEEMANTVSLQAGLRTLHEAGPEIKRATSVDLDEAYESDFPSTRR